VPLHPPEFSTEVTQNWTRCSTVRSERLIVWAIAWPFSVVLFSQCVFYCWCICHHSLPGLIFRFEPLHKNLWLNYTAEEGHCQPLACNHQQVCRINVDTSLSPWPKTSPRVVFVNKGSTYSSKKRFAVACAMVYIINMSVNVSKWHSKWVKSWLYEMEEYNHELLEKAPITTLETATIVTHAKSACVYACTWVWGLLP
jgi:hypothetical protein